VKEVWLNAAYFVGAVDLTSQTSRIEAEFSVAEIECTTFGSGGAEELVGGLESANITASGYVDYGGQYDVNREMYANRRVLLPHTIGPSNAGAAVGVVAYVVKPLTTSVKVLGPVGQVLPWEVQARGSSRAGAGAFLVSPSSALSTSGDGTPVEIGAIGAGRAALATLHVLEVTGSATLDVVIESDATGDFNGSETQQITFPQMSGVGSQFKSIAGPITDTYWRATWTIGGTGTVTAVVALGISLFAV